MSLSDCPKCWDSPCTCGFMSRPNYEKVFIEKQKERFIVAWLEKLEKEHKEHVARTDKSLFEMGKLIETLMPKARDK